MESVGRPVGLAGRVHVKKQWRVENAWEQTGGLAAMLWEIQCAASEKAVSASAHG